MNTIYKYACPIDDAVDIKLPAFAKVLTVAAQGPETFIWCAVDTDAPKQTRRFHWRETGHDITSLSNYVGTVQLNEGRLVFHLFEGVTIV